jgi:hypothetical protein
MNNRSVLLNNGGVSLNKDKKAQKKIDNVE